MIHAGSLENTKDEKELHVVRARGTSLAPSETSEVYHNFLLEFDVTPLLATLTNSIPLTKSHTSWPSSRP